jgi:hypothetical protein
LSRNSRWGQLIPAAPFLAWLDEWSAAQERMRTTSHPGFDRPVAGLTDLADMAGTSARAFSRARETGSISLMIVDMVLTRASDTGFELVYPESEFPQLYTFEAVA